MDRKDFIRTTGFSLMAMSLFPLPALSALTDRTRPLQISNAHHIRHGLLSQLDPTLLQDEKVLFQKNNFSQGLPAQGASEELEVLSVLTQHKGVVHSTQLSCTANEVLVVGSDGSYRKAYSSNTWQPLVSDQGLCIELYRSTHAHTIQKQHKEAEQHHFIMLTGAATVDGHHIDTENGIGTHGSGHKLRSGPNNCVILCVSSFNKI